MNILRAEHLGMCFGVRDAIQKALAESSRRPLTILGDLVHNETVMEMLWARGIRTAQELEAVGTGAVMVTAHGASDKRRNALRELGFEVMEATCPLVVAAHRSVLALARDGFYVVLVGKAGHVEVRGLTEDLAECTVVLDEAELARVPERPRYGVAAQTTQPVERVRRVASLLRQRFPRAEVRLVDTVCQPTKLRQHAAEELARRCDVVIVVGGAQSNNTRELASTCRRAGARVYHVQSPGEVDAAWLAGAERVGLTAGTSTPDSVIESVERRLRRLAAEHERAVPRVTAPGANP